MKSPIRSASTSRHSEEVGTGAQCPDPVSRVRSTFESLCLCEMDGVSIDVRRNLALTEPGRIRPNLDLNEIPFSTGPPSMCHAASAPYLA